MVSLVRRLLGEYFAEGEEGGPKISLLGGQATWKGLVVKAHDIGGLRVVGGTLESIVVEAPWKRSWRGERLKVRLRGLRIDMEASDSLLEASYDQTTEPSDPEQLRRKRSRVAATAAVFGSSSYVESEKTNWMTGFVTRILCGLVRWVDIVIDDVYVTVSLADHDIRFIMQLSSVSMLEFNLRNSVVQINKEIILKNLLIAEAKEPSNSIGALDTGQGSIAFNVDENDLHVQAELGSLAFNLTSTLLHRLAAISVKVSRHRIRSAFGQWHQRPAVYDAKKYWSYAINCVITEKSKSTWSFDEEALLERRRLRNEYTELFRLRQTRKHTLNREQQCRFDELEAQLSEQDLIRFRLRANLSLPEISHDADLASFLYGDDALTNSLTDADRDGFRNYAALSSDDITAAIVLDDSLASGASFHLSTCSLQIDGWKVEFHNCAGQHDRKGTDGNSALSFATCQVLHESNDVVKCIPRIEEYSLVCSACHKLADTSITVAISPVQVNLNARIGLAISKLIPLSCLQWSVDSLLNCVPPPNKFSSILVRLASAEILAKSRAGALCFRVASGNVTSETFGSNVTTAVAISFDIHLMIDGTTYCLLPRLEVSGKVSVSDAESCTKISIGVCAVAIPTVVVPFLGVTWEEWSSLLSSHEVRIPTAEHVAQASATRSVQLDCPVVSVSVLARKDCVTQIQIEQVSLSHLEFEDGCEGDLAIEAFSLQTNDGFLSISVEKSHSNEWDLRWFLTDVGLSFELCLKCLQLHFCPTAAPTFLAMVDSMKESWYKARHSVTKESMVRDGSDSEFVSPQNQTIEMQIAVICEVVRFTSTNDEGPVVALVAQQVLVRSTSSSNVQRSSLSIRQIILEDRRPACNLHNHLVVPHQHNSQSDFMVKVDWKATKQFNEVRIFLRQCALNIRLPVLQALWSHLAFSEFQTETKSERAGSIAHEDQLSILVEGHNLLIVLPHGGESCDALQIPVQAVQVSHSFGVPIKPGVSHTVISAKDATVISLAALDDPSTLGRNLSLEFSVTDSLTETTWNLLMGRWELNLTQDDYLLISRILHENLLALEPTDGDNRGPATTFNVETPEFTLLLLQKSLREGGNNLRASMLAELSILNLMVSGTQQNDASKMSIKCDDVKIFDLRESTLTCFRSILSFSKPASPARLESISRQDLDIEISSTDSTMEASLNLAPVMVCVSRNFCETVLEFLSGSASSDRRNSKPTNSSKTVLVKASVDLWAGVPQNLRDPECSGLLLELSLRSSVDLSVTAQLQRATLSVDLLDLSFCPPGFLCGIYAKHSMPSLLGPPDENGLGAGRSLPLHRKSSSSRFPRSGSWVAGYRERRPTRGSVLLMRASPTSVAYTKQNGLATEIERLEIQAACSDLGTLKEVLSALLDDDNTKSAEISPPSFALLAPKINATLVSEAGPLLRSAASVKVECASSSTTVRSKAEVCLEVDGFNSEIEIWEPILEAWKFNAKIEFGALEPTKISVSSSQRALINSSPSILRKLPRAVKEAQFPTPKPVWDTEWEGGGLEPAIYFLNVTGEHVTAKLPYCDIVIGDELTYCAMSDDTANFIIAGWAGNVEVPISKCSTRTGVFTMTGPGGPNPNREVCFEVRPARNCMLVRIQSSVSVQNTTLLELDLLSAHNVPLGKLGPGQHRHIPLRLCGRQDGIRLLPYHARHQYHATLPFFPQPGLDSEEARILTCKYSGGEQANIGRPFVFRVERKSNYPTQRNTTIIISAPILVENGTSTVLDVEATFGSEEDVESIFLSSGQSSVFLRDPANITRLSVTERGMVKTSITFKGKKATVDSVGNMETTIKFSGNGSLSISVFYRFLLLNKTFGHTPPLVYHHGNERGILGHDQSVTIQSETDGTMRDLRLAIGRSPWSKKLDLIDEWQTPKHVHLHCPPGDSFEFSISVEYGRGPFARTKVIMVKPAWVMVNSTPNMLFFVRQRLAHERFQQSLSPTQTLPIYWGDDSKPFDLQLRLANVFEDDWSSGICLDENHGEKILLLPDSGVERPTFVRLSTRREKTGGGCLTLTGPVKSLSDLVVHNMSSFDIAIDSIRRRSEGSRIAVKPGSGKSIAWSSFGNIQAKRGLYLYTTTGYSFGYISIESEATKVFRYPRSQISGTFALCYARIVHSRAITHLVFSESQDNLHAMEQRLRANNDQTKTSLTIALAGIGVSLFGGKPTQELVYAQLDRVSAEFRGGASQWSVELSVTDIHIDNFVTSSAGATDVKPLLTKMIAQPILANHPLWWSRSMPMVKGQNMLESKFVLEWINDESNVREAGVLEVNASVNFHPIEVNIDAALVAALGEIAAMHQQFENNSRFEEIDPDPLNRATKSQGNDTDVPGRVFVRYLAISSILARLSVKVEAEDSRSLSRLTGLPVMHALTLGNADRAELCLAKQEICAQQMTGPQLVESLSGLYRIQIIYNLYEAVSSLDNMVLSPTRLLIILRRSIELIVSRFYSARSGPEALAGVGRDLLVASVLVIGRTITKAAAAPDAFLTLWMAVVEMDDSGSVYESFRLASNGLSMIANSLPWKLSVTGLGLFSFSTVAPALFVSRLLRLIASSLDEFLDDLEALEKQKPLRPPRAFSRDGGILPYRFEKEELGRSLMTEGESRRHQGEVYLFFALSTARSGVLVSSRRISLFGKNTNGTWFLEWTCFLADISSISRDGRKVSIMSCRERLVSQSDRPTEEGAELADTGKPLRMLRAPPTHSIAPAMLNISCLNEWAAASIVLELSTTERSAARGDNTIVTRQ